MSRWPPAVVLATGNAGKLRELQGMLASRSVRVHAQSEFNVPPVAETGESFVENALIKARHAVGCTGLPAIADDSGLLVDALGGAPGVRSARYAGENASDSDNLELLLERLAGVPEERRTARFACAMVFLAHAADPLPRIAQATWEGRILETPRGTGGFGYDPVFLPASLELASAELDPEEKNRRSHRGQALQALVEQVSGGVRDSPP